MLKLAPSWTLAGCWLLFIEQTSNKETTKHILPATKNHQNGEKREEREREKRASEAAVSSCWAEGEGKRGGLKLESRQVLLVALV